MINTNGLDMGDEKEKRVRDDFQISGMNLHEPYQSLGYYKRKMFGHKIKSLNLVMLNDSSRRQNTISTIRAELRLPRRGTILPVDSSFDSYLEFPPEFM